MAPRQPIQNDIDNMMLQLRQCSRLDRRCALRKDQFKHKHALMVHRQLCRDNIDIGTWEDIPNLNRWIARLQRNTQSLSIIDDDIQQTQREIDLLNALDYTKTVFSYRKVVDRYYPLSSGQAIREYVLWTTVSPCMRKVMQANNGTDIYDILAQYEGLNIYI